ncbi:glutathione S-transferase family protein [Rhizobium sp. KVB221]|uniref:glutathione transferase n=1 Tax=Rhizobium setariae TaxID=2801340 RepID=A0A936YPP7_9HYPH|nr:glutathione S-transferase family protein [Rhizobium setariae]MBL0374428.1 glutathione S-transferase family protein [Rhizobium setariae]
MTAKLKLVSFDLCPYVQRAAIALAEKGVPFERITIDLTDKPDWFKAISPLGKVPLLMVGDEVLFESAAIVEYLDETVTPTLHPEDALTRARHRGWVEFGSQVLANIWTVETTKDRAAFDAALAAIGSKFERLEAELGKGPFFAGEKFTIVDAVFAPVFRYFDGFEQAVDLEVFVGRSKLVAWRRALAARPSVRGAVVPDYTDRLLAFVRRHDGLLAGMMKQAEAARRSASARRSGVLRRPATAL